MSPGCLSRDAGLGRAAVAVFMESLLMFRSLGMVGEIGDRHIFLFSLSSLGTLKARSRREQHILDIDA